MFLLLSGVLGLLFTGATMPFYIAFSNKLRLGQPIRQLGPRTHTVKAGTPTAGGIVILAVSIIIAACTSAFDAQTWIVIAALLAFAAIGLLDDFKKLYFAKGISARQKLLLQYFACIAALLLLTRFTNWHSEPCRIPFTGLSINMGYFYWPFCIVVVCGSANAVNLTDGLDGLVTIPICLTLAVTLAADQSGALTQGTSALCIAIIGSCLGFLIYNRYPARVFMGDTGSLAIGALIGLISVILHQELLLAISGGVFVIETLSVIGQVTSFKLFKRRIFKMAPLHHHFEQLGMHETKVTVIFWCASLIFACLGLSAIFR
jgi:phospho-N-acetylmuramoyl-pentapeptide-transferase